MPDTGGKTRILILIPTLEGGGAERVLINLLHKIDYSKYSVDLAVVSYFGVYVGQVPDSVRIVPLFKTDLIVRILALLQKKTGFSLIFRWIIRDKIRESYDVGISFIDSNFTDLLFFVRNIRKKIAWIHSSYKSYAQFARFYKHPSYRQKLIKHRYSRLDHLVFVSEESKQEFIGVFGRFPRMEVIYNLLDADSVRNKSLEPFYETVEEFLFVSMGSLWPVKGFDRLIRAAVILKNRGYKFRILILGEGPEYKRLNTQIKESGLDSIVRLMGYIPNPYPYLKNCDAFVMSSVSEALPTALGEAMILGKPVLVTNSSGCRELTDNGRFGLMCEQDDQDMAEKMIHYLKEPELKSRYASLSLERATLFDDNALLRKYSELLDL